MSITYSKCWKTRTSGFFKGFTMPEVLVVIFIVGIIIALIIPAVLMSRESARKAGCIANLKQLGIAFSSYVSNLGSFPMMNNGRKGYSAHSMILPYIDNGAVFNSINFSLPFIDRSNITSITTEIKTFLCPSDSSYGLGARNSYPGNVGHSYQIDKRLNGIFVKRPDQPTHLSDIRDGSSTTGLIGEWVLGSGDRNVTNPLSSVFSTGKPLIKPDEYDEFIQECKNVNYSLKNMVTDKGLNWLGSGLGGTNYDHNMKPFDNSCTNGQFVFEGAWTASSFHNNGCHLLFADGHAIFIKRTVNLQTWRGIATRAGGEVISEDDF